LAVSSPLPTTPSIIKVISHSLFQKPALSQFFWGKEVLREQAQGRY